MTTLAPEIDVERGAVPPPRIAGAIATLSLTAITGASLFLTALPLAQVASIVGIILLVGSLATSFVASRQTTLTQRVVLSLAVGLLGFLVVGTVAAVVLHALGVSRPLTRRPLLIVWCSVLAIVAVLSLLRRNDPVAATFEGLTWRHVGWSLVLTVPPLLALLGVERLNSSSSASLSIAVGVLAIVLAALAVALPAWANGPPRVLLLASSFLTAAWQSPFRGGWLSGYDIQHEYSVASTAVRLGRFPIPIDHDPYNGMLTLTVWPAQVHALTGLTIRSVLAIPPSVALALCLVAAWCAVRERVGPRLSALLCVLFVLGSEPLVRELPSVTRQCYALFFFAVLIMVVSSSAMGARSARWIAVACGIGVAVSHYSSAYIAAGAVIVGWLLTLAFRTPRSERVLTAPVAGVITGWTILWGLLVARTGSNFHQLATSIRDDGFRLLPGAGNVFTRWIHGASVSQLVNARVIRANDLGLRLTYLRWMQVQAVARHVPLVNSPAPTAGGVRVLGPLLSILTTALAELLLVGAFVAVLYCLWIARRDRRLAALAGMGVFGIVIAALSRSSQTLAVDFGPTRVQAQMYLVFVVVAAACLQSLHTDRSHAWVRRWGGLGLAAGVALALLATVYSTQLMQLSQHKGSLPLEYAATGEQIERVPVPADLDAARYIARLAPRKTVVQADYFGQLALFNYGFAVGRRLVPSVDPIIVDNGAWVLATATNLELHRARGGTVTSVGAFVFPYTYLASSRAVLYTSSSDAVFGQIPYRYVAPKHTNHPRH